MYIHVLFGSIAFETFNISDGLPLASYKRLSDFWPITLCPMCSSQWSGIFNGSSPAMASFLLCSFQIKSIQNFFTVDIDTSDRPIFSLACYQSR